MPAGPRRIRRAEGAPDDRGPQRVPSEGRPRGRTRPGHGGEHAPALAAGAPSAWRVLTDLSGPFDTVVLEVETDSLATWERARREMFASPEFQADFARGAELMVSGRNELYTIEAQG